MYFPDGLLFDLLLVDLFDGVSQVVIEVDSVGTDEDDVGSDGSTDVIWEAVLVEEDHFFDVEVFGVIKRVAVKTFNQDFGPVVPEVEGVHGCDEGDPFFLGMQGQDFYFGGAVDVEVEEDFILAGHGTLINNIICKREYK